MQEKNKKTSVEIIADNERLTLSKLASLIGCKPQNMYDILNVLKNTFLKGVNTIAFIGKG